ncbi:hypothetical protein SAMN05421640_1496 [Ekhidna lutea]|uniref:Uncharacterized protein n=1 Tax=Ekhidna lutea TaxID=447679 RepID=A0A239HTI4_EKHLU|nr:hypothetical protein [Ekhidna lutea]SNS84639.1 hypothetical protein SAMN05421640_1496 [Ekhidna lutea]
MKQNYQKVKSQLRMFAITLGFILSGMIVLESLSQGKHELSSTKESYDSLKTTIQNNKALLVNSYLLGASIIKEALD